MILWPAPARKIIPLLNICVNDQFYLNFAQEKSDYSHISYYDSRWWRATKLAWQEDILLIFH